MFGRLKIPGRRQAGLTDSWRRWLSWTAGSGVVLGLLWWLCAAGGAFYGDGTDYHIWLDRDLALGALGVLAGLLTAFFLVRARRKNEHGSTANFIAAVVGSLLGSVIAWRMGVFAGDLFHKPPTNMPSPSMVFSLRAPAVLLLWPLVTAIGVFIYSLIHYAYGPVIREDAQRIDQV